MASEIGSAIDEARAAVSAEAADILAVTQWGR
jgi:hypothetical protein